jgi:curved DNA-binding protein CbpA
MFSPNSAEIKGTFQESPFPELLVEAIQAELSGSFRLAHAEEKAIVYLKAGEVIFAVSNLRQHRLFEMLLQIGRVSRDVLTEIPNFTNDLELAEALITRELLTKKEADEFLVRQIKSILAMAVTWQTGGWSFSHLARAKEGVSFKIDTVNLLLDYARSLSDETIIRRFKSFEERFAIRKEHPININLLPSEGFIFSRLESNLIKIQDIKNNSGLSDLETLKSLYILWMAGFLVRKNWNCTFTENRIQAILSAKLILKKEVLPPTQSSVKTEKITPETVVEEMPTPEIDEKQLLDEYLKRVEAAESYYEILDVPIKAKSTEIKTAYFSLAKQFHPDKYHQEEDSKLQQRVQHAFTEIARAYETLKDDGAREVYDFKLRKYLETVKERQKYSSDPSAPADTSDKAREEFEQGFAYLMEEDYAEALPYLARAAQMSPDNPRYRAYLGKVLSVDENQRHKAEAEIQAAIKLDPNNATFRIMLVEFFIQYNLLKRAEGELNRILTQFPNNKEAQALLDSLKN